MVFTDCDQGAMGAIAEVFPGALNKLCIWHTMKNIQAHGRGLADGVLQSVLQKFKAAAYAARVEVSILVPCWRMLRRGVKVEGREIVRAGDVCGAWLPLIFLVCFRRIRISPDSVSRPFSPIPLPIGSMLLSQDFVRYKTELLRLLPQESEMYKYMARTIFGPG